MAAVGLTGVTLMTGGTTSAVAGASLGSTAAVYFGTGLFTIGTIATGGALLAVVGTTVAIGSASALDSYDFNAFESIPNFEADYSI